MATFDKRPNGKWRAQVRRQGLGAVSRNFVSKKAAEKWARETEAAIECGSYQKAKTQTKEDISLGDLLERYKTTVSVHKKGAKMEATVINALQKHSIAKKKLGQVSAGDWAKYRDERLKQIKPQSLRRQFNIFQHVYEVARDNWGYQIENPLTKVSLKYTDQRRERRVRDGELDKILAEASKRKNKLLVPIIKFACISGMRRSEILNITWNNIDFRERELTISKSKNGHSRKIPLLAEMISILEELDPTDDRVFPISEANFKSTWKRILAKTGIEDFHFHDYRHEALSSLFEKGLEIPEVASISGHKTWKCLSRYTSIQPKHILNKLERVAA